MLFIALAIQNQIQKTFCIGAPFGGHGDRTNATDFLCHNSGLLSSALHHDSRLSVTPICRFLKQHVPWETTNNPSRVPAIQVSTVHLPASIQPSLIKSFSSYVEDPKWQRRFTTIWGAFLATAVVCSLPYLVKSVRNGRMALWFRGVGEDMRTYTAVPSDVKASNTVPTRRSSGLRSIVQTAGNVFLWSPPGLELNMGQSTSIIHFGRFELIPYSQVFAILVYLVIVLVCIIVDAPLRINSNRAGKHLIPLQRYLISKFCPLGFIALAQFPVVFLFATKNSVLSLLLGPGHGYEKLNYIHRWASRCMFLGAAVHGGLWINNHLRIGLPLLGQEKETTGIAAFGVLCVIVLTSVRWARNWSYETFFVVQSVIHLESKINYLTVFAAFLASSRSL